MAYLDPTLPRYGTDRLALTGVMAYLDPTLPRYGTDGLATKITLSPFQGSLILWRVIQGLRSSR
jgi:hypothetical protein